MFDKKINKIIYVSSIGYKQRNSNASINRIKALQEGFKSNGIDCLLHFIYAEHNGTSPNKLLPFISLIKLFRSCRKGDVVIFYGNSMYILLSVIFRKLSFYVEKTEYPYYMIINNRKHSVFSIIKEKLSNYSLCFVKGLITCSESLKKFYSKYINERSIYILPVVINIDQFLGDYEKKFNFDYIAYCGSLGNNKDGVPILIESFSCITYNFPDLKLVIIGNGSQKDLNNLKLLVNNLNLFDRVVFTGAVNHQEIPSYLKHAKALALARPNNKQAEGGFPSKVGEYLASGVPSVITSVGEIPNYICDGEECILVSPDSVESFAAGLKKALLSDKRNEMVNKALEKAKTFSSTNQSKNLFEFIITNE